MALAKLLATGALAAQARHAKEVAEARIAATAIKAIAAVTAGLFALIALVFASLAVFFWLSETQPPHIAALWVAGGLLVIALLFWMIGAARARSRLRKPVAGSVGGGAGTGMAAGAGAGAGVASLAHGAESLRESAMDKGYELGAKVNDSIARHPYKAVGTAVAVGVALALLPRLGRRKPPPPPPPRC